VTPAGGRKAGLALVVLLALLVHARALDGVFFFDDDRFITRNDRIAEVGNPLRFFQDPSTQDPGKPADIYRPLRTLAFALERAAFGLDPRPFHAVQVLLHAGCAALVYLLLIRLGIGAAAAAAAGALFAVHPAQVEAVAWISSLADVMGAFFTLLAVLAWLRSRGPDRWYALALLAGLLASLSKEAAIVFPGFLVLADLARPDGGGPGRVRAGLRSYVLPFLLAGGLGLCIRSLLAAGRGGHLGHVEWWGGSLGTNLATAAKAAACQGLFAVLPFRPSTEWYIEPAWTPFEPLALLCGVAVLAVLALAVRAVLRGGREARLAGTGVLFFALGSLMTSHVLFTVGISRTDRFLYLPLAGAALSFAVALERLLRAGPRPALAAAAATILSMAVISADRIPIYRDEEAFWKEATAGMPGSRPESRRIAVRNLEGVSLLDGALEAEARGETENARALCARARAVFEPLVEEVAAHNARWKRVLGLLVDPGMEIRVRNNLALSLLRGGDPAGALRALEKVLEAEPEDTRGLHLRARALRALGRIQPAGWCIEKSVRRTVPGLPPWEAAEVLNEAAAGRLSRGLDGAALRALRLSVSLVPDGKVNAVVDQLPALERTVEERRRALAAAVAARPGEFDAALAFVLYEGRGGTPAAARKAFAASFGPAPATPALRALWAIATMEADDTEDGWRAAEAFHRGTLVTAPAEPGALLGIARCREALEDRAASLRLYREVLALPGLPAEVRREAEEGLRRLGG
jgi:tetratricopeptide (TPR) repeat protein